MGLRANTGYPLEGLGWVHLQLMSPHDVKYSLQIYNVIAFSMDIYYYIIHVSFYGHAYMLEKDCIHCPLICRPCVLHSEGHHGVTIHPQ